MGIESKKEYIHVYVLLTYFSVQQKVTQLCKSAILRKIKEKIVCGVFLHIVLTIHYRKT